MNFLNLPREIRDLILEHLMAVDDAPPPNIVFVKKWNNRVDKNDPTATKVLHSSLPGPIHALSQLPLVNRQLYQEVKDFLNYAQMSSFIQPSLKLDLLLHDLTVYYTTWLRVLPYPGSVVNRLHICIRPFFALQYGRDVIIPHFRSSTLATPSQPSPHCHVALWRLGAVINALLRYGPARIGLDSGRGLQDFGTRPFIINTIIVDIVAPELGEGVTDENDVECVQIAKRQTRDLEVFVERHWERLLSNREGGVSEVPWGLSFLRSVKKIVFVSGGKVLKEKDIAKLWEGPEERAQPPREYEVIRVV